MITLLNVSVDAHGEVSVALQSMLTNNGSRLHLHRTKLREIATRCSPHFLELILCWVDVSAKVNFVLSIPPCYDFQLLLQ